MRLLAIDPGPSESAYVLYDTDSSRVIAWEKTPNDLILAWLDRDVHEAQELVVEMIASYGMPVGKEVFETCVWVGKFEECWRQNGHKSSRRFTRMDVKHHLCHSSKAADPNVRQALIDRFGPGKEKAIGLKASPGPLYGLSGDGWAALGVAVTAADTMALERAA